MQLTVSIIDSARKTAQQGRIASHYEFATHKYAESGGCASAIAD